MSEVFKNEGKIHQHGEFPTLYTIQLHMKPYELDVFSMLKVRYMGEGL